MNQNIIDVYTDGSCDTQYRIGGWAAVILIENDEIIISGFEFDTTHNRMELLPAIKSFEHIKNKFSDDCLIRIYSDSQYLVNLINRINRFKENDFMTKKGAPIQNADLVRIIIGFTGIMNIEFIKVPAHCKKQNNGNFNRKADMLSRKIVREQVKKLH